jgi:serine/threonine protein kinase/tetratricopeptide (TPR) repeat protein
VTERAVFDEALGIADPIERAAFLDKACGDDLERRRNIDRMLGVQPELGSFLESPAALAAGTLPVADITEGPGTQIGPYRLLEEIGEGGFGVVYLAEQTEPVKRRVALKIIKPGMDTREVIARFEAERQALALMDHPCIARVLDAGATDAGRPYFVMELVKGISITDYCDQCHLATRDRLELFLQVCQAIQHAHQKGVIHRDVKPGNVLIAMQDGRPVPKVIDFGVAKAINQRLTDHTLLTRFTQVVGTPLYMSPEQAEMSPLDVDTRSDIYSLGVLLYELLTGTTPFERQRLKEATFDELRRIIREEEPLRPSARISTLGADVTTIAERRRTEPRKLQQLVRGDLDWIALKALEKDRTRRYETADSFARDIRRFLNHEPVDAHPPAAAYRFMKFARRKKRVLVTATTLASALVVATVVSTWQAVNASRSQRTAQTEAAISRAVAEFINRDLLAPASPLNEPDRNLTVREALDRASERIDGRFEQQPLVEAAVRHTLGTSYLTLGEYGHAERHLQRAVQVRRSLLGAEHEQTLASMTNLATAFFGQGRYTDAEQLNQKLLDVRQRVLGPEHRDTLISMMNLAATVREQGRSAEAERHYREILRIQQRVLDAEHPQLLKTMMNLAAVMRDQGDYVAAEQTCRNVLPMQRRVLRPEHPDTLAGMTILANSILAQGRYTEAETLHREVLEIRTRVLGPEHPDTLESINDLSLAIFDQGRYAEAAELRSAALEMQRRILGREHPATLQSMMNLANVIDAGGDHAEAESLHRQVYDVRCRMLGPDHPDALNSALNLANAILAQQRYVEAEELYLEILQRFRLTSGVDHPATLRAMANLAVAIHKQGRFAEAETLRRDVVDRQCRVLGPRHPDTLAGMLNLANSIAAQGRSAKAEERYRHLLEEFRAVLGPEHPSTLKCMMALAKVIETQGRHDEAGEHYRRVLQLQQRVLGADHPDTRFSRNALARLTDSSSME